MTEQIQRTTDEIGQPDEINQVLFFDQIEQLGIELGAMKLSKRDMSNDVVWDGDGTQSNWDDDAALWDYEDTNNVEITQRVINPFNRHIERFLDIEFEDDVNTTASWGTSNLSFTTDTQQAQSESIHLNQENIIGASINAEGTNVENALYYLSADGGNSWEQFTLGLTQSFISIGQDLRYRIINGTGSSTTDTITTENGDILVTESGDTITSETIIIIAETLTTESGDTLITEAGDTLITEVVSGGGQAMTFTKLIINYTT